MAPIVTKLWPIAKLFLDAQNEIITFECTEENPKGKRTPHPAKRGKGYQRDAYSRLNWAKKHAPVFSDALCKAVDVSDRGNGTAAVMDGGARCMMAEMAGKTEILCRVHTGLTRQEEARLFVQMDSATYGHRAPENFVAELAAGEPMAVAIAKAIQPYTVAPSGAGTLKCVNPLAHCYVAFAPDFDAGITLLKDTCDLAAYGWSGFGEHGRTVGGQIGPYCMLGLAMLVEAANGKLDKAVMRRVLAKNPHASLVDIVKTKVGDPAPKGHEIAVAVAKFLARTYNRSFLNNKAKRLVLTSVDNTSLFELLESSPKNYSAMVREARQRDLDGIEIDADEVEDEAEDA